MKYKTYLFDLDGTLTDSREGILNAAAYALNKLNKPIPDQSVLQKFLGPPLWESFEKLIGMTPEEAEEAVKIYREYYSTVGLFENRVYEGIPQLLTELKAKGCLLGVATCKPEPFSIRILDKFGLSQYFGTITGCLLDGTRRTKAEVINCALDRLGVSDRSSAVMIGDRLHDIVGAKETGLESIGVLYGYGSLEEFSKYGAEYTVKTPKEILDI